MMERSLRPADGWQPAGEDRTLVPSLTGPTCAETKRVAVISPYPDRVHQLVRRLSVLCYDVLLFHRFEPALIHGLPLDLVLLDASALAADGRADALRPFQEEASGANRIVWLLEESHAGEAGPADGHVIVCRSGLEEAVPAILDLFAGQSAPSSGAAAAPKLVFKDVVLYPHKRLVTVRGASLNLTKTEYELLLLLMEAQGAVLSRDELLERIWGSQLYGSSNVVDVHVRSLRKKLGDPAASPAIIVTVRGVGYRLADA